MAQLSVQLHLRYLIISQDQRDQSYSTVKTTSTAVTVNNLKPGTLYIFQIRTSSSPDYGNYNPGIEVETLAECKCSRAHVPVRALSWARGTLRLQLVPQLLLVSWSSTCSSGSASPGLRATTVQELTFPCIFPLDFDDGGPAALPVLALLSEESMRAATLWLLSHEEAGTVSAV